MSIRERLLDATVLWQQGRREGALLSVLVALAATSRKRYPYPQHKDGDAFKMFLSDEMLNLTRQVNWMPTLEWSVRYKGQKRSFEHFLYKFLRCELAHQAKLPPDIEFRRPPIDVAIMPENHKVLIDPRVIVALSSVVLYASENNDEFPNPADDFIDFNI